MINKGNSNTSPKINVVNATKDMNSAIEYVATTPEDAAFWYRKSINDGSIK